MKKENKHTRSDLYQMQSLSLKDKIKMTQRRIEEWYEHYDGNVYVSFSGGKDSTVLLDIARKMYPEIVAVHVNTGLEYPEIEHFVKTFENVEILRPEMTLMQVIRKYGYPMFSKEVSECVYGARKYLTSLLESMNDLPTDRPTDRPTRPAIPLLVRESYWNRSISEASKRKDTTFTSTKRTGYLEFAKEIFSVGGVRVQSTRTTATHNGMVGWQAEIARTTN